MRGHAFLHTADDGGGRGTGCLRGKQVAVKFFSPQREENGMGRQMAAVRAHAAGSDSVKGAADQFSADDVADAVRREGNHERKME